MEINIPYSIEFLADLDRTITRGRLTRYMVATSGNIDQALQLYEKNVLLSEALFGFLHGLEVTKRNSIDVAFSADIGIQDWYQNGLPMPWSPATPQTLQLTNAMQNTIADARSKAGAAATVGKLVAELPFGFWTMLLGNRFDDLWRRSLHNAFPYARTTRRVVHWRLDTIRLLRNRIAHHEPILSSANHRREATHANAAYIGELVTLRYDPRDMAEVRV